MAMAIKTRPTQCKPQRKSSEQSLRISSINLSHSKKRPRSVLKRKMTQDKKNLAFLQELEKRFKAFRAGDPTQGDYVAEMLEDWINELKAGCVKAQ